MKDTMPSLFCFMIFLSEFSCFRMYRDITYFLSYLVM